MTTVLTPEQIHGRERFSIRSRQNIEDEAIRDESKPSNETTLWKTVKGSITNLNYRYTVSTNPIALFEWDMHDFWHLVMSSAKVTDADDAGQDRLVAHVLRAREMGTIFRNTTGGYEEAETTGGKIWSDLPYLVPDFEGVWRQSMHMKPRHRINLAAFTARLLALGVGGDGLSSCALWLFRETLETTQEAVKIESEYKVAMTELLPACIKCLEYCAHKLLLLSVKNHDDSAEISALGELAIKAQVETNGLSIARWVFWRSRFKELTRTGNEMLKEDSKRGFQLMIRKGREMGLKVPGEQEYDDRMTKYLHDKRKSMGPNFSGVVSSGDMSIHSDED